MSGCCVMQEEALWYQQVQKISNAARISLVFMVRLEHFSHMKTHNSHVCCLFTVMPITNVVSSVFAVNRTKFKRDNRAPRITPDVENLDIPVSSDLQLICSGNRKLEWKAPASRVRSPHQSSATVFDARSYFGFCFSEHEKNAYSIVSNKYCVLSRAKLFYRTR